MNESYHRSQVMRNAVIIKCCVPNPKFGEGLALWCAGMSVKDAQTKRFQTDIASRLEPMRKNLPISINNDSIPNLIERAKIITAHARRVPKKIHSNGIPSIDDVLEIERGSTAIADYCSLAGFPREMLQGKTKPEYQQVYVYKTKLLSKKVPPLTSTTPSFVHFDQRPLEIGIQSIELNALSQPILSPLQQEGHHEDSFEVHLVSNDTGDPQVLISPANGPSIISNLTANSSIDNQSNDQTSFFQRSTAPSNTSRTVSFSSKRSASINKFSTKVNDTVLRKTSKQANRMRHDQEAWDMLQEAAYEVSTKLYDRLTKKTLPLVKFKSAEDIAEFINAGFECDLISGQMIRKAFQKNFIGKAPEKAGRKPKIPKEETTLLANLLFSANSIDQANSASNRMDRPQQISTIGRILNSKQKEDDNDILNDTFLFLKHIEPKLSLGSSVEKLDKRELLRLLWLTYAQQKKHYINWEHNLVYYDFGRHAENEEEIVTHGRVVFHPDSLNRMIHIDEMGFSYDGSKNGVGGRIAAYFSNSDAPESGIATAKSSLKISVLFGATYAGNPIPPSIVLPSTAKKPKLELELLLHMHQIKGKFGYSEERYFNPVIGKSSYTVYLF